MFATFFPAMNVNRGFFDTAMMNTSTALKNARRQNRKKKK
jgi:hypothetical protein